MKKFILLFFLISGLFPVMKKSGVSLNNLNLAYADDYGSEITVCARHTHNEYPLGDGSTLVEDCYPQFDCESNDLIGDPDCHYSYKYDDPPSSPIMDCAGVVGGTAYLADCGCIGGSTGIDYCPPADPPPGDTPTPPEDPCAKAKKIAKDSTVAAKLTALTAMTGDSLEQGDKIHKDGTIAHVIGGASGFSNAQFNLGATEVLAAFLHSHDLVGNLSIFSDGDISTMYDLIHSGHADGNFYMGLVTNSSTKYILQVSDLTAFNTFFGNPVKSLFFTSTFGSLIKPTNSVAANELAFLKFMEQCNLGLKLSKANSTFTGYTPLALNADKNGVVDNPCPTTN